MKVPLQRNGFDCGIFTCMFGYLACTRTGYIASFDKDFFIKKEVRKRSALAVTRNEIGSLFD